MVYRPAARLRVEGNGAIRLTIMWRLVLGALMTISLLGVGASGGAAAAPAPPAPQQSSRSHAVRQDCTYFTATRHTLCGGFRAYWERFGGLAIFGYPITEEYREDGTTVQWFERARFEWRPGSWPARYDVVLGLLGREVAADRGGQRPFRRAEPRAGCIYSSGTGHNLCGGFRAYWERFGDIPTFGYPISEEFSEDGRVVQYFERARFEWHPGAAPDQYDVLLGRLGARLVPRDRTAPVTGFLFWAGDVETGDLRQWSEDGCGGEFNSGDGDATASRDVARSGSHAAKLTISGAAGTRLFRWCEPREYDQAYYSAWFYFPEPVRVSAGWWTIFEFKSSAGARNDPFWVVNVGNRPDGSMYLWLYDSHNQRTYRQEVANLPTGRWVQIQAYLDQAGDNSGHVTIWQDGARLWDLSDVQTRYPDGDNQWGLTNYSGGLSPSTASIYVDDAVVSNSYVR